MNMFAAKGVTAQIRSRSYDEAVFNMEHSCRCCQDGHGNLSCDNCPIMKAHHAVVAVFDKCGEAYASAAELFAESADLGISFDFA